MERNYTWVKPLLSPLHHEAQFWQIDRGVQWPHAEAPQCTPEAARPLPWWLPACVLLTSRIGTNHKVDCNPGAVPGTEKQNTSDGVYGTADIQYLTWQGKYYMGKKTEIKESTRLKTNSQYTKLTAFIKYSQLLQKTNRDRKIWARRKKENYEVCCGEGSKLKWIKFIVVRWGLYRYWPVSCAGLNLLTSLPRCSPLLVFLSSNKKGLSTSTGKWHLGVCTVCVSSCRCVK